MLFFFRSDHRSVFEWVLAVVLAIYTLLGAPFSKYIPILKELVQPKAQEPVLDAAALERLERAQLRREQEEELEQSLLEDKVRPCAFCLVACFWEWI